MYVSDSRRIFFPANAPAKAIPIDIDSPGEISSATNVQDAVQMLADDISVTIGKLPPELNRDASLRTTIDQLNMIIRALRHLRTDGNSKGKQ